MSAFMGNRKTYARTEFFSVEPMLRVEGARSREDRGRRRRPRRGRSEPMALKPGRDGPEQPEQLYPP
jgi:hypothetical protein